jgi:hypothetical protein
MMLLASKAVPERPRVDISQRAEDLVDRFDVDVSVGLVGWTYAFI